MLLLVTFLHATTHLFGHPPPYHYQGMFPLQDNNFIMFQPYREFILHTNGKHYLCRAYDEPKCTFWNARLLSGLNQTMNHTIPVYVGAPWVADIVEYALMNYTTCVDWCKLQNCTAMQFWHEYYVCVISKTQVRIDMSNRTTHMFLEQKMPTRQYIIHKNREVRDEHVQAWIDLFVQKAECRLNKFRCHS